MRLALIHSVLDIQLKYQKRSHNKIGYAKDNDKCSDKDNGDIFIISGPRSLSVQANHSDDTIPNVPIGEPCTSKEKSNTTQKENIHRKLQGACTPLGFVAPLWAHMHGFGDPYGPIWRWLICLIARG